MKELTFQQIKDMGIAGRKTLEQMRGGGAEVKDGVHFYPGRIVEARSMEKSIAKTFSFLGSNSKSLQTALSSIALKRKAVAHDGQVWYCLESDWGFAEDL